MSQPNDNKLMNNFKYPIEYIYLGLIPDVNISGNFQGTDWHKFHQVRRHANTFQKYLTAPLALSFDAVGRVCWQTPHRTIDSIQVTAHGVNLY